MNFRADPPLRDWPALAAGKAIVTGHQPWLWHPGILAKYLAADAAMSAAHSEDSSEGGGGLRHVVVDQDVQDALRLSIPRVEEGALRVEESPLGRAMPEVPAGCQPRLTQTKVPSPGVGGFSRRSQRPTAAEAASAPAAPTLASQVNALLESHLQPLIARPLQPFFATRFADEPWFHDEVRHLLHDAATCVKHYNDAVRSVPQAGVSLLGVERDRVELPLWKLSWQGPRLRVYADLSDTTPMLATPDGEVFAADDPEAWLAPRALLMTAWVRRRPDVGLFVHGSGGAVYDRVTERWWRAWRGETLCPMAVATADVTLDFDVPTADDHDVTRAVWRAHHVPHNLDRELNLQGPPAREKRELLRHMNDDRDKARRRAAFHLVHRINADLQVAHPAVIHDVRDAVRQARVAQRNTHIARKRDWSILCYPPRKLESLRDMIQAAAGGVVR